MREDVTRLTFPSRADFRLWLAENGEISQGVWLVFGKTKALKTIKAGEALEEALCFGWIDGQMQSIDENSYIKYFSKRRAKSPWSDKNKKTVTQLRDKGLMTAQGEAAVDAAIKDGRWEAQRKEILSGELLEQFEDMLKPHEAAYNNYMSMARSVRKSYAGWYFIGAKTEEGKRKRFKTIIERLELNLNPMQSMKK